jgi:rhodanese-related sulfurtransferase
MIEHIHPGDLKAWTEQVNAVHVDTPAVVLDVREPIEVETAHIQGLASSNGFEVVYIPMGDITSRLQELNPQQPVACLCHHGARSMQVARYLVQQGFKKVANIEGGIHAWSEQVDSSVPIY